MLTVPCGKCRYPIRLDVDLWHMRRHADAIVQVCDACSKTIDSEQTADALTEARACAQVNRAVRTRLATVTRPEGLYRTLAARRAA